MNCFCYNYSILRRIYGRKKITCKNCMYWEEFKLIPGKKLSDFKKYKGNFNARRGDCRNDRSPNTVSYSSHSCDFAELKMEEVGV